MLMKDIRAGFAVLWSTVFVSAGQVTIFSNDPQLVYSGNWASYKGCYGVTDFQYSSSVGASVSFRFPGSSISVNLLTGIYSGSAQIIVDGDFVGNVDTYQSTYCSDGGFAKFAVFNRDNLTVGEHNITVVNGGPSHVGTRDIDIYSFIYTCPNTTCLDSTSTSPITSTTTSPITATANIVGSTSPKGGIIGGAVGGVLAVCILVLMTFLFIRYRKRRQLEKGQKNADAPDTMHDVSPQVIQHTTVSDKSQPVEPSQYAVAGAAGLTAPTSTASTQQGPSAPSTIPKDDAAATLPPHPSPSPLNPSVANRLSARQLGVVRNLVERNLPDETIADVIEEMIVPHNVGRSTGVRQSGDEGPPAYDF